VGQRRDGPCFSQKSGAIFFGGGGKEFHRHAPPQRRIFGEIHNSHSALTELVDDPIMGDSLAYHVLGSSAIGRM
jgi:hypothetical protein